MRKLVVTAILPLFLSYNLSAQEKAGDVIDQAKSRLHVEVKDSIKPLIYIDGKQYDHAIVELLDESKIESINVIKGQRAIEKFNAPQGVIQITSKAAATGQSVTIKSDGVKIESNQSDLKPLIMIDGEAGSREELDAIDPDDIESVSVVKGDKALKEYNAPNGVVIVKMKSKKSRKKK